MTASLIEHRLRDFRQLYASLFIAYSLHEDMNSFSLKSVELNRQELEALLPPEHHLIVMDAGNGSFWIDVKTAAVFTANVVKKAPQTAFLTAALLFSSSREKVLRILEAETRKKEEEAKQAAISTQKAKVELQQLSTAQEKAHDEMMIGRVNSARAAEAYDLLLKGIKNAQDKDQLDAFMKALQVFDSLKDQALKDQLRSAFVTGAGRLLGPNADSPPASTVAVCADMIAFGDAGH